ncbi:AraC family transcriptional regulator [Rhodopila sp.]|uniref:AraC family transcriptional regulator n=1 Tax=Rhodopila sp. TaxID=2480087 RepID=UPI003D0E4386
MRPALLDAMRVVEIRKSDLVRCQAEACNYGPMLYRLREPQRVESSDETLSKIGDSAMGPLMLSCVSERFGTEVTFQEAHPYSFCVMAVLQGAVHYRSFGSETAITAMAGHLLLGQTKPGAQALTADGSERLNLWINRRSLVRCLEAMLDRPLDAPLTFVPEQAWPRGTAASLNRLVRYVADELTDPYSLFAGGVGVAGFEDLVIRTILEGTIHSYTEPLVRAPSVAPPHAVRRATEFMRENLLQPLTVEDIAQATGCSARALAAAFRSQCGQTVTSVLRELRLEAARTALLAGDVAIGAVCARFGFSNAGRFAALYRERFGALPLHTRNERR